MGYYTSYDILIGNPNVNPTYRKYEDQTKNEVKKYKWHDKSRLILKDGTITPIGESDLDGEFTLLKKNISYSFSGANNIKNSNKYDGIFINNKVYNILSKHKNYKKCIKDKNFYKLLKKYYKKKSKPKTQLEKYLGSQDCLIPRYPNNVLSNKEKIDYGYILEKDIWKFVDPDLKTKDGLKNKKRILNIIDNFVKFACKEKIEKKGIISLKLIFKNNKSNKFWNIEYSNIKYIVNYGKIGNKGKILSKKSTLNNTKKLIDSKIKKGYKKKAKEKNIKKFTLK